ncbi:MAG: adenylate/guanylate cyclase domain-containing protein [Armatimonadetes bacterium]|nr:adenylate/guanylate cyclase domain-containing protein [Armatimonadota bacterium]
MKEQGFFNKLNGAQRLQMIGISVVLGLFFIFGDALGWFAPYDAAVQGAYLKQRNKEIENLGAARNQLLMVVIDDASLRNLELKWPIPRSMYLTILGKLKEAGATTVGLDILFENPGDPAEDALLAKALSDPAVVIAYQLRTTDDFLLEEALPHETLLVGWTPAQLEKRAGFIWDARGRYQDTMAFMIDFKATDWGGNPIIKDGHPVESSYYSWPVMLVSHHLQISPQEVVDRCPFLQSLSNTDLGVPVTAEVATLNLYASQSDSADVETQTQVVPESGVTQAIASERADWETMASLRHLITVVTLEELLSPDTDVPGLMGGYDDAGDLIRPEPFIAIVGTTAEGTYDQKMSRVGPIDGVTLNSTAVLNLLRGDFLEQMPPKLRLAYSFATFVLVGLAAAFFTSRLFMVGLVGALLAILGVMWAGLEGHLTPGPTGGLLVPLTAPFLGMMASSLVLAFRKNQIMRADLEKVIKMFQEVCPVHDLESLLEGQGLQLGGEERELTILFSDLRGYTSFAEKLDSVTVLNTLNQYFGAVGHIFERYGGFVFDYQGDAQMVVFGLQPASRANHAASACRAGAAMIATLNRMREKWLEAGQNIPETGVGICTGPVSFGVLGTQQHKQYVAIGDPTNTASRTQGKSAELNAPVLITESTYRVAGSEILAEELEPVHMKGKRKPINVYRVKFEEMIEKGMVVLDDLG